MVGACLTCGRPVRSRCSRSRTRSRLTPSGTTHRAGRELGTFSTSLWMPTPIVRRSLHRSASDALPYSTARHGAGVPQPGPCDPVASREAARQSIAPTSVKIDRARDRRGPRHRLPARLCTTAGATRDDLSLDLDDMQAVGACGEAVDLTGTPCSADAGRRPPAGRVRRARRACVAP
jgi:hypothetical protein